MKRISKIILSILLFIPIFVLADKNFDDGKKMANDYIYSLPEYSRYLLSSGNLPFGYDTTGVVTADGFSTGGFLNEQEFYKSRNSGVSWLAPGIQYWLTNRKAVDLMVRENVVSSGVRVTEYVKHGTKVKGIGTITTPWEFVDGYTVKIVSNDKSKGTVLEPAYEHVEIGSTQTFTFKLNGNFKPITTECENNKNGHFEMSTSGDTRTITVSKIIGDFTCSIGFNVGCNKVTFNDDGGSGGMHNKSLFYKYGSGWFTDERCTVAAATVSKPTRIGYTFLGYKSGTKEIINTEPRLVPGVKDDEMLGVTTAKAEWRKNRVYVNYTLQPGETLAPAVVNGDGVTNYFTSSGITIFRNGIKLASIIEYGGTTGIYGLGDYLKSSGTMDISKPGYIGKPGEEWACYSGNCNQNTYNMATVYQHNAFCDASAADCSIQIKVNWVRPVYSITLDKQSGSGGTSTIYEKYAMGYYTDAAATTQMSSSNGIIVPTRSGYSFEGYYTGTNGSGTQYINASGKLTSSASNTNFSADGTLYAKWKSQPVETSITFASSCAPTVYTVPTTGKYLIELWGASGWGGSSGSYAGKGAYTKGEINLTQNTVLYFYIGGQGTDSGAGTCNGGGKADGWVAGGSGGGATDVRLTRRTSGTRYCQKWWVGNLQMDQEICYDNVPEWKDEVSLRSRIMVAAGGGGKGYEGSTGGNGGGLTGGKASGVGAGHGAQQTIGGEITNKQYWGQHGLFGVGGGGSENTNSGSNQEKGGGAGGGYYGGGGGSGAGSGGGGSSYISGHQGCVAVTSASNSSPKSGCSNGTTNVNCSKHYSNYVFSNTSMSAGNNTGNGKAKITYLGS